MMMDGHRKNCDFFTCTPKGGSCKIEWRHDWTDQLLLIDTSFQFISINCWICAATIFCLHWFLITSNCYIFHALKESANYICHCCAVRSEEMKNEVFSQNRTKTSLNTTDVNTQQWKPRGVRVAVDSNWVKSDSKSSLFNPNLTWHSPIGTQSSAVSCQFHKSDIIFCENMTIESR